MKPISARRPHLPGFVALYGFWSVAVLSRALYQYATRPLPHLPTHLSLCAGLIYLGITVAAWSGHTRWVRAGLWIELAGVCIVSTVEHWWRLPYTSAWSGYGSGYVWLPLVLPIAGLWLSRQRAADAQPTAYNDE